MLYMIRTLLTLHHKTPLLMVFVLASKEPMPVQMFSCDPAVIDSICHRTIVLIEMYVCILRAMEIHLTLTLRQHY